MLTQQYPPLYECTYAYRVGDLVGAFRIQLTYNSAQPYNEYANAHGKSEFAHHVKIAGRPSFYLADKYTPFGGSTASMFLPPDWSFWVQVKEFTSPEFITANPHHAASL